MVSTRLTIEMDCELAKKNYPKVIAACHFENSCKGKKVIQIYPPGKDIAKEFYMTPWYIQDCVKNLFTPQMEIIDGKVFYYKKEGMSARPQYEGESGFFTGARDSKEKCGFRSLNNIVNGPGFMSGFPYLKEWQIDLEYLGYRQGLSMALIPYDWRLDPAYIVKHYKFRAMAESLYEISGKKMAVLTHSYGLNVGYQGVLEFKREERNKYFTSFISVGGPWLGAGDPLTYLTGMDLVNLGSMFPVKVSGTGMMENLPVLYTLTPKDTYERFAKESWVKKMLKRRAYELNEARENPFSWLPGRKQLCEKFARKEVAKDKSSNGIFRYQCEFGIEDYKILSKVGKKFWTNSQA